MPPVFVMASPVSLFLRSLSCHPVLMLATMGSALMLDCVLMLLVFYLIAQFVSVRGFKGVVLWTFQGSGSVAFVEQFGVGQRGTNATVLAAVLPGAPLPHLGVVPLSLCPQSPLLVLALVMCGLMMVLLHPLLPLCLRNLLLRFSPLGPQPVVLLLFLLVRLLILWRISFVLWSSLVPSWTPLRLVPSPCACPF